MSDTSFILLCRKTDDQGDRLTSWLPPGLINPTPSNSRITTWSYGREKIGDDVFDLVTTTRHDASGTPFDRTTKNLISTLSATVENKQMTIDPRQNTSTHFNGVRSFILTFSFFKSK